MSKMKGLLEENMIQYPELYNGHADEEFWTQCQKLLKKKNKSNKIKKGNKNGRTKRNKI